MSLEQQWQAMVKDIMATKTDSIDMESGLKTRVIHFSDERDRPLVLPKAQFRDYWNTLEFSPEVFSSEFAGEPSSAVFFRDCDFQKPLGLCKKVYFSSSTNLDERKKSFFEANPELQVNFGVDPYSLGLWQSQIFKSSVSPVEAPCKVFRLSGLAFDLSGAGSVQQLAIVLAAFVQLVEDYKGWWDVEDLFKTSSFEISLNSHLFSGVAKIGALRLLIKRMALTYGFKQVCPPVFAVPSPRYLSTREPHNNLLRLATMNMAAIMGGASGFINLAYDLYSHNKGGILSRNRDILLKKESFLSHVEDPCLGSYSMDYLIESMNRKAWCFFQEIINKGGLCQCLRSGWLQEEIIRENNDELRSFMDRKRKMTGVNEFVLPESLSAEHPLVKKQETRDIESWWSEWIFKENNTKLCDVKKLVPVQISQSFEDWQFRADAMKGKNSDWTCLQVWVEPGLENSRKWTKLVQYLYLGGLEVSPHSKPNKSCHPLISIILASDPEGSFCRETLKNLTGEQKTLCFWVGEKKLESFHDFIGESSDMNSLFERIFNVLEKTP